MFSLTKQRIPALLKISSEKNTVNRLKKDIKQLNLKLSELQALLEGKEAQLCLLRRYICLFCFLIPSIKTVPFIQKFDLVIPIIFFFWECSNVSSFTDSIPSKAKVLSSLVHEENLLKDAPETSYSRTPLLGEAELNRDWFVAAPVGNQVEVSLSNSSHDLCSSSNVHVVDGGSVGSCLLDGSNVGIPCSRKISIPFECCKMV